MAAIYLYPLWLRLWHLVNAILFLLLIITGLTMQYANQQFNLIRFDVAVSVHNVSGIILTLNYLFFLFRNIFSDNGKYYKIYRRKWFSRIAKQLRYYTFGLFKGEDPPFPVTAENKFNPLQKFSYVAAMFVLMPLIIITGWGLIFPEMVIIDSILGASSLLVTDLIHIIVGFILSIFMFVHIYFCTIGHPPGSNFIAMITGWHKE